MFPSQPFFFPFHFRYVEDPSVLPTVMVAFVRKVVEIVPRLRDLTTSARVVRFLFLAKVSLLCLMHFFQTPVESNDGRS